MVRYATVASIMALALEWECIMSESEEVKWQLIYHQIYSQIIKRLEVMRPVFQNEEQHYEPPWLYQCLDSGYPKNSIICAGFKFEIRLMGSQGSLAVRGRCPGKEKEKKKKLSSSYWKSHCTEKVPTNPKWFCVDYIKLEYW